MNIKELLLTPEQIDRIGDLEATLLRRKERGTIAGYLAVAVAVLQVIFLFIEKGDQLLSIGTGLPEISAWFSSPLQIVFWAVFILSLLAFFLLRFTNAFLRESREPFRYTFWIEPFRPLGDKEETPLSGADRLENLLDHDLKNLLNERIKRFSVLEEYSSQDAGDAQKSPSALKQASHIHIYGHYVLRLEENGSWVVQITPLIRIGPRATPASLATPIRYVLTSFAETGPGEKQPGIPVLSPGDYNQIVERVYSRISTEVYARIEEDVKEKIKLFPSNYLKALALYHEAEDFARSNTIDGYERAISLFKHSLAHFHKIGIPSHWRSRVVRLRWASIVHYVSYRHAWAKSVIGYAKCMIYRNQMASLSGRKKNPLFALPELLEPVIGDLEDLHRRIGKIKEVSRLDFLTRSLKIQGNKKVTNRKNQDKPVFDRQRKILFEAYITSALTFQSLGAIIKANEQAKWAEVTAPDELSSNPFYLLAKGLLEPELNRGLLYFQNAVDLEPGFQIAHWFLANALEKDFRRKDEISPERAQTVISAYDEVLSTNAGNIASMGAKGHLFWLVEDPRAEKILRDGAEVKALSRETFIGDINFRLARIAAEKGDFNVCRNRFLEASAIDPSIGAFSLLESSRGNRTDYDALNDQMLRRFETYHKTVTDRITALREAGELPGADPYSAKTIQIAFAFVLNDFGNACLRHFHYHGDEEKLLSAISAFQKATEENPEMAVAWYNLQNAYRWAGEWAEADKCMEQAMKFAPNWSLVAIQFASSLISKVPEEELKKTQDEILNTELKLERLLNTDKDPALENFSKNSEKTIDTGTDAISNEKLKKEVKKLEEELETLRLKYDELKKARKRIYNTPVDLIRKNSRLAGLLGGTDKSTEKNVHLIDRLNQIPWEKQVEDDIVLKVGLIKILSFSNEIQELECIKKMGTKLSTVYPQEHNVIIALNQAIAKITFFKINTLVRELFKRSPAVSREQKEELKILHTTWEVLKEDYHAKQFDLLKENLQILPSLIKLFKDDLPNASFERLEDYWIKLNKNYQFTNHGLALLSFEPMLMASYSVISQLLSSKGHESLAPLKKEIQDLIEDFFLHEKHLKNINSHFLIEDQCSFLTLYWLLADQNANIKKSFQDISEQFFSLNPAQFQNLLGNVYLRFYAHTFAKDYLKKARDCFLKAIQTEKAKPNYHFNLGETYYRLEQWSQAEAAIREALRQGSDVNKPLYRKKLAATLNQLGNYHSSMGNYTDARDYYQRAIDNHSNTGVYYYNLYLTLEDLRTQGENLMEQTIQALERAILLDPKYEIHKDKLNQLKRDTVIRAKFGWNNFNLRPGIIPITVEYDKSLDHLVMGPDRQTLHPALLEKLKNLRRDFTGTWGITLPGLLFRLNDLHLSTGQYFFTINEIPSVLNQVYQDQKYSGVSVEELNLRGIEGINENDILNRKTGYWIQESDWGKLESAGLKLLDPLDFIFRDLVALLSKNLPAIFGIQEAANLCKESARKEIQDIPRDADKLRDLAEILKGLLAEEIPVVDFEDIAMLFLESYNSRPLDAIMDHVRQLSPIKAKLPGNTVSLENYFLGSKFENLIKNNLGESKDLVYLGLYPHTAQELLTSIRNKVPKAAPLTLVVADNALRMPLKALVELEFKNVYVLAKNELLHEEDPVEEKTIEIEYGY